MTIRNVFPFALAILMFVAAFEVFSHFLLWLGFRDGFMSELDYAEAPLAKALTWFFLAMGVAFVGLGAWSLCADVDRLLIGACLLVLAVAASSFALDLYFRSYLMNGSGG